MTPMTGIESLSLSAAKAIGGRCVARYNHDLHVFFEQKVTIFK